MKRTGVPGAPEEHPEGSGHGQARRGERPNPRTSALQRQVKRSRRGVSILVAALFAVLLVAVPVVLAATPARTTAPDGVSQRSGAGPHPVDFPFGSDPHVFGLSPSTGSQGTAQVRGIEHLLGRKVNVVNFYAGWTHAGFATRALDAVDALGAVPQVTWEPWNYRLGTKQARYALSRIVAGDFDGYIRGWAKAAAKWGKPLLLRFAQEMNGTWYPWGATVNGNTAGEYVRAYRHVASVKATNVIWVWSPNILYPGAVSLSSVYPGNAYVNWIGVDGYNWGTSLPHKGGWRSPAAVFVPTLDALKRLAPTKPVMIAETASAEQGGSKAAWITNLFKLLQKYPEVRAVSWFNYNKGGTNWKITSSKTAVRAMKNSLAKYWRG
jgi:hypothetical protein